MPVTNLGQPYSGDPFAGLPRPNNPAGWSPLDPAQGGGRSLPNFDMVGQPYGSDAVPVGSPYTPGAGVPASAAPVMPAPQPAASAGAMTPAGGGGGSSLVSLEPASSQELQALPGAGGGGGIMDTLGRYLGGALAGGRSMIPGGPFGLGASIAMTPTPAETGELPPQYWPKPGGAPEVGPEAVTGQPMNAPMPPPRPKDAPSKGAPPKPAVKGKPAAKAAPHPANKAPAPAATPPDWLYRPGGNSGRAEQSVGRGGRGGATFTQGQLLNGLFGR